MFQNYGVFRRAVLCGVVAMLVGLAAAQGIETITFEPAPLPGGSRLVDQWVEKDIQFTTPNKLGINDLSNDGYPYNGTAFLDILIGETPLTLSTVDGQLFSLYAVDLAEYSTVYTEPKAVTFVGTHADGSTSSVTFTTDGVIDGNGPLQDFETFAFPATFTNLQTVTVDTDRFSMDNLQVAVGAVTTPTPTPTPTPGAAPVIIGGNAVSVQVGVFFTFPIPATGSPTAFAATGLPDGVTMAADSGLISGTPTVAGTFPVVLSASNAFGTGTSKFTLNVTATAPPPTPAPLAVPVITSATTATAAAGQPFAFQITAAGSPTAFGAVGLPVGLSVDPNSGLIAGTTTLAGKFSVVLDASNSGGTGTAAFVLTVTPAPTVRVVVSNAGNGALEGHAAKVVVYRDGGGTDTALTVRYKVAGGVKAGVDYKALSGSVIIPAGAAQTKLKVKFLDNQAVDGLRTLKIKLKPSEDGSYVLENETAAKLRVFDND